MEKKRWLLLVCPFLVSEVKAVIKLLGNNDAQVTGYSANCGISRVGKKNEIARLAEFSKSDFEGVAVIGSNCLNENSILENASEKIKIIRLDQCFDILLNPGVIEYLLSDRAYLTTPGWLKDYERHLRNWGFDESTLKDFFSSAMKEVVLLNTGKEAQSVEQVELFAEAVGLPFRIIPVGTEYLELFISKIIHEFQVISDKEQVKRKLSEITKISADYALLFDSIKSLLSTKSSDAVLLKFAELFNLLFAPSNIYFVYENSEIPRKNFFEKNDDARAGNYEGKILGEIYETKKSLEVAVNFEKTNIGKFYIINIAFPEYVQRYLDLSELLGNLCGLMLDNAAKYELIQRQKRQIQESLEVMENLNLNKDKMFSVIAHDLRSPFNGLLGITALMAEEDEGITLQEYQRYSQDLFIALNNQYRLLISLLTWAQAQMGELKLNLTQRELYADIDAAVESMQINATQKNIAITVSCPVVFKVFADGNLVQLVIRNLLSNALKFTPHGGKIKIEAVAEASSILIIISDNGKGINPDRLASLFTPWRKSSEMGTAGEKGAGLGLTFCREVMDKMNGQIRIESSLNKGTTAYLQFVKA